MNNNKIAELILRAQNASDGGKNIFCLGASQKAKTDNTAGYRQKDVLIIAAISLINKGKSNWKYAVTSCQDFYYDAFIVYFQTKIEGEKVQISFHSFNKNLEKYIRKSFRIKWDHGDSRESAVRAYDHYCNGLYL